MKRTLIKNPSWGGITGLAVLGLLCLGLAAKESWSLAMPFGRAKVRRAVATPVPEAAMAAGRQVYLRTCFVCHQADGRGIPGQMPPLAKSDYLMADKERSIRGVLAGQSGEMTVNGKTYNGVMLPLNYLSDDDIANVLTYVRNSMGNAGEAVTPEEVRKIRTELPKPEEINRE